MVCPDCEKKKTAVICPDVWKDGARNTLESGGRKINENKLLTKSKIKATPYGKTGDKCIECKKNIYTGKFCQTCAYRKGVCNMCGKKIMDTKGYRQSTY